MTHYALAALLALIPLSAQTSNEPPPYEYQQLVASLPSPPYPVQQTIAHGINDFGTVVGIYNDARGDHSFVLRNGTYTPFDVPFPNTNETQARGINLEGAIVGSYQVPGFTTVGQYQFLGVQHGFLRKGEKYTSFDFPSPTTYATIPTAINDLGQIVGIYGDYANDGHSFLRTGNNYVILAAPFPGTKSTSAAGINDLGEVIGSYLGSDYQFHGFLYFEGNYLPLNVPVPGAYLTQPMAINNRGDIAGYYTDAQGYFHGFLWNERGFTTIDVPASLYPRPDNLNTFIDGINDFDQLVGTYGTQDMSFLATRYPNLP